MNRLALPLQLSRNALALFLCALLVLGSQPLSARSDSAHSLFIQGQKAEARDDFDAALGFYQKAYAKSPQDLRMRTAYYRLRQTASSSHVTAGRKKLEQGDQTGALADFMQAAEIDPGNEAAVQQISALRANQPTPVVRSETSLSAPAAEAMEEAEAPAELKPVSNEPLTLHMGGEDTKTIYQAIGRAAGINVLFDPDYTGKRIQVDLNNVNLMDALRIVGTLSNTFWRPVTENTIFVAANTRAKRTELDEQAVQTFYLSNAWQQNDLNDVQTALRNVLPNSKVYGVPSQNAIVMRATPDELMLAQKVINDLDKARPEVVVDIAVMEVNRDKMRNIGLSWPGSISFALQPPQSTTSSTSSTCTTGTTCSSSSTTGLTLDNLANLNATNFAITVSSATANLLLSDSDTKILQNPRIRSTDQQKATMKIGSRIPVATGSFQSGAATAITSSLVNTQFQYQDVGVQIEMTPTVHFDHDVTLKLHIEVTSQSGSVSISGVTEPIISQRTDEQVIRLREGEASILGGILEKQDLVSSSGIPGLGELPLLKYIFGSRSHEVIDDEIVFLLIPHVVRGQDITPLNLRTIDTGAGTAIELRRISATETKPVQPRPTAAPVNPPARPPRPQIGSVGPITGQTAEAAAPSALAQLRQSNEPSLDPAIARPLAPPAPAGGVPPRLSLVPPVGPQAVGATFQVPVALSGANDIASVPLQIQYDPGKLKLINVDSGDLLGKDGQAVALVHRDDGPGMITIAASRPPGVAGVSGSGTVCTLTFQAAVAGESDLVITRPGALDSAQRMVAATAINAHIIVK
jgi:general secretion pathway protein D